MRRSLSLLSLALFAAACSSSPSTGKNGGAQKGGPGDNGQGSGQPGDPSDPNDPTEEGGGDNDAGSADGGGNHDAASVDGGGGADGGGVDEGVDVGGTTSCPAAAHGWRSMASASGVNLVTFNGGFVPSSKTQEAVWTGHEVLALGGDPFCAHAPCTNIAMAYDPAKDAWRKLATPPTISSVQTRWAGDRWLVVGNVPGSDALTVVSYDPSTNTWSTVAAPPLSGRAAASMAVVWSTTTHELLLWGGAHFMSTVDSDGAALNPATGAWRLLARSPLSARADVAAAWDGTRMVLVGGGVWDPGKGDGDVHNENALADAGSYDPATDTWTMLPTPAFTARIEASAASLRAGETFVFGGVAHNTDVESGLPLWEGAQVSGTPPAWATVSPPPIELPAPPTDDRFSSTFVAGDGFFFVWGGAHVYDGSSPEIDLGDGATFDVATGAWTKVEGGGPSPRKQAIGVWTGCDTMVYGGAATGVAGTLQNGMLYRP